MTEPTATPTKAAPGPAAKSGADMRASFRRVVALRARVLVDGGAMLEGKTQDLSTGGVGLLLSGPLVLQSKVQVAIQMPKAKVPGQYEVITGPAKVVFQVLRGGDYQIGMQWLSLDSKTLSLLQAFTENANKPAKLF